MTFNSLNMIENKYYIIIDDNYKQKSMLLPNLIRNQMFNKI